MLKAAAVVLLSIPILLTGVLLSSSCVVVDVKQAEGPRIIVPVPLFAARAALRSGERHEEKKKSDRIWPTRKTKAKRSWRCM